MNIWMREKRVLRYGHLKIFTRIFLCAPYHPLHFPSLFHSVASFQCLCIFPLHTEIICVRKQHLFIFILYYGCGHEVFLWTNSLSSPSLCFFFASQIFLRCYFLVSTSVRHDEWIDSDIKPVSDGSAIDKYPASLASSGRPTASCQCLGHTYIHTLSQETQKVVHNKREYGESEPKSKMEHSKFAFSQSKEAYAGGRTATPTLRRQAGGSLRASLHAGPLPIPSISSHDLPTCSSHELRGRPLGLLHSGLSLTETTRWAGSASG